jgi:hypothetical protein
LQAELDRSYVVGHGEGEWTDVAVWAALARATQMVGVVTTLGPWLRKYSDRGTTTMPTMTVSTKVMAPHSRRTNAQVTSAEF